MHEQFGRGRLEGVFQRQGGPVRVTADARGRRHGSPSGRRSGEDGDGDVAVGRFPRPRFPSCTSSHRNLKGRILLFSILVILGDFY
jgi:hypothetical protein